MWGVLPPLEVDGDGVALELDPRVREGLSGSIFERKDFTLHSSKKLSGDYDESSKFKLTVLHEMFH
jgi:hypothetical protein